VGQLHCAPTTILGNPTASLVPCRAPNKLYGCRLLISQTIVLSVNFWLYKKRVIIASSISYCRPFLLLWVPSRHNLGIEERNQNKTRLRLWLLYVHGSYIPGVKYWHSFLCADVDALNDSHSVVACTSCLSSFRGIRWFVLLLVVCRSILAVRLSVRVCLSVSLSVTSHDTWVFIRDLLLSPISQHKVYIELITNIACRPKSKYYTCMCRRHWLSLRDCAERKYLSIYFILPSILLKVRNIPVVFVEYCQIETVYQ